MLSGVRLLCYYVGSSETSAKILIWTFNQTFVCNVPVLESQPFHQRPSFSRAGRRCTHMFWVCLKAEVKIKSVRIFFHIVRVCLKMYVLPITVLTFVVASSF